MPKSLNSKQTVVKYMTVRLAKLRSQTLRSLPFIPGVSPSVADVPQDDTGLSGKSSAPPILSAILRAEIESLKYALHPSAAQRRHRVFPVPVGLSSTPFTFYNRQTTHHQLKRKLHKPN